MRTFLVIAIDGKLRDSRLRVLHNWANQSIRPQMFLMSQQEWDDIIKWVADQ